MANHGRSSDDRESGQPASDPYPGDWYPRDPYQADRNRWDAQAPARQGPPERGPWPGQPGPRPAPSGSFPPPASWQRRGPAGPQSPVMPPPEWADPADGHRWSQSGPRRATGPMRTAKPIAPGTGKARVILPFVVLGIIAAGFLGVVYLWWRDTLFQHGHGALFIDIGEVLGLIGGYGVIILVALMSRLPPLEKAIGTDRLARWHAPGGRSATG